MAGWACACVERGPGSLSKGDAAAAANGEAGAGQEAKALTDVVLAVPHACSISIKVPAGNPAL